MGPSNPALAQPSAKPHRIDVHHHLSPPGYITEIVKAKVASRPTLDWTPARGIEDMDRAGVASAMTSITTPAVSFLAGADARRMARECNEYGARLAIDHPGRFGVFAALPVPDIDGCLAEIAYGLDTLKADGIALLTSYGTKWLGDASLWPILDELNRRRALVYTHPTTADCCRNLIPSVPDVTIEFGTDTTRAIASLLFSGAARKFPDIRWIFSHAGGTMPFLAERFIRMPLLDPALKPLLPDGVEVELKRFYYDTAQAANPMALSALLKLIPISQVVFGTDVPFRTSIDNVKGLGAFGFNPADLSAIERDNAARLLPRFA